MIVIHNRSFIGVDTARVQVKRLKQAESVARLAQGRQDVKLIIVGDVNAYQFTDGYTDVVGVIAGDFTPSESKRPGSDLVNPNLRNLVVDLAEAERYSYVFNGNAQALDHALVNARMASSVVEMVYARGNADAAAGERRNADSALYASDHDGFVVFLAAPGREAPPPLLGSGDAGGGGDPEGPDGSRTADLTLDAEGEVLSDVAVRYRVRVMNVGTAAARNVVATSSFSGGATIEAATSGCREDPDGVPTCTLGGIGVGEAASFTVDVGTKGATETRLLYRGVVGGDRPDPTPRDAEVDVSLPLGPPNAPSDLAAAAIGSTEVELRWRDNSRVETGFDILLQGPGDARMRRIGSAPSNATSMVVDELVPDVSYRFAVEARNGPLRSGRTAQATARTWYADGGRCAQDDVLCLGRFEVEAAWTDGRGRTGRGGAHRLTASSGDFWFFHPENVELVVKVLDGCRINGHYWVFAAGLTDVEVRLKVRDVDTGEELVWTNPQGALFEPLADDRAFAVCRRSSGETAAGRARLSGARPGPAAEVPQASRVEADPAAEAGVCDASATAVCLQGARYQVRVGWKAADRVGEATAIPRSPDTGMFWFFSPDNVELLVKVLDGCALNGHRWVLMGGLTDVRVDVSVTDSRTGQTKTWRRPGGSRFRPLFDVNAFACGADP